jgi:molybdate transport system substrate-binding protein
MTIKVLSTLALMGALPPLAAQFEQAGGGKVDADFAPTGALLERLRAGESADLLVLTEEAAAALLADGTLSETADVAVSSIGLAVAAGKPAPAIGTAQAFKDVLAAADSLAYSRIGASGLFFADLIKTLGIEEMVKAKAVITPGGLTAKLVVQGRVQMSVQQMSELLVVPGIGPVTPLPPEIQCYATFTAGVVADSPARDAAARLMRHLTSPEAAPTLRASGLQPANPGISS